MLAGKVGAPTPGVFCLKAPLHSICESKDFIFLGGSKLQVGWLHLISGRSEFTNLAADPSKHTDDQVISIQEYGTRPELKLFAQSKAGWFGCIKVTINPDNPTRCILQLEHHLTSDFVGFCKFPLLVFDSQEEEDMRAFMKKSQPESKVIVVTNSLDGEGKLHLLTLSRKGIEVSTTPSEACRFIDPQPVFCRADQEQLREDHPPRFSNQNCHRSRGGAHRRAVE